MGADLGRQQRAGVLQHAQFSRGGDVQDVEPVRMALCQIDGPADANDGRFFIANLAVHSHRPRRLAQPVADGGPVRFDGGLVLAVGAEGQRRLREDAFQGLLRVDQQVAGAGPDEDFDARRAAGVGGRQFVDVVRRRPEVEAPVDEALRRGDPVLRLPEFAGGGVRDGVGHLQHGRDPAGRGGPGAGVQVLLVRQPGVAEMHLVVHDPGERRACRRSRSSRRPGRSSAGRSSACRRRGARRTASCRSGGRRRRLGGACGGTCWGGWTGRAGAGRMPVRRCPVTRGPS